MKNDDQVIPFFPCIAADVSGRAVELVFISSFVHSNKQLKYTKRQIWGTSPSRQIDISSEFGHEEVWALHEAKDGYVHISPLSDSKKFLSSDSEGRIHIVYDDHSDHEDNDYKEKTDSSEKCWIVERAPNGFEGVVIINASTNYYLYSDGHNVKTSEYFDRLAVWQFQAAHRESYAISLMADKTKFLQCTKETLTLSGDPNNIWELRPSDDNSYVQICFRPSKCYLAYDSIHHQITFQMTPGHGSKWILHLENSNGAILQNKDSSKFLQCTTTTSNCVLSLGKDQELATVWSFQPSIPQYKSIIPRPLVIGALAVAAPFAVTGTVAALGFSTTGIVAGSVGARMMSISATLAGGGVPAGGVVATMQSVGAVGLGIAGTASASAAGAVTGATVTRSRQGTPGCLETTTNVSNKDEHLQRLFCEWRYWPLSQN